MFLGKASPVTTGTANVVNKSAEIKHLESLKGKRIPIGLVFLKKSYKLSLE